MGKQDKVSKSRSSSASTGRTKSLSTSTAEKRGHSVSRSRSPSQRKHKKRRHSSTESSSSSSSDSSTERRKRRKEKKRKKKAKKEKRRLKKAAKHAAVALVAAASAVVVKVPVKAAVKVKEVEGPDRLLADRARAMAPMTKEEWDKRQSVIRKVLDPETGRQRLIKGDGEVIEECVSRERQKEINRKATRSDGDYFQSFVTDRHSKRH